tara:strand:- start:38 stop:322 length:285 start_codon:yes stop_codon:yes gene_type:complete
MINKNTTNNNMTIVRNIAYSQIQKINKKIKEEIEVDNVLLEIIDINMKNAINKIINTYKLSVRLENVDKVVKNNPTMSMFEQSQLIKKMNKDLS